MKNILIVLGVFLLLAGVSGCGYNSMVQKREAVNGAWGNVESAYQRRADLVPNLVNTVKGAANFEQTTITQVIEARAKASSIQLNVDDLNQENLAKFQQAQDELKGAMSRLLVTVEQYPQLKATENFKELQSQLEGTENRINTERTRFNDAVKDYNAYIAQFPQVLFSGMFGFKAKSYFESQPGAEKAPTVDFSK